MDTPIRGFVLVRSPVTCPLSDQDLADLELLASDENAGKVRRLLIELRERRAQAARVPGPLQIGDRAWIEVRVKHEPELCEDGLHHKVYVESNGVRCVRGIFVVSGWVDPEKLRERPDAYSTPAAAPTPSKM